MVRIRKGMVEAILLPFFDITDLVRFAGLCWNSRKLLSPQYKKHINFHRLFQQLEPDLDKDAFQGCETWMQILKVCADKVLGQTRLVDGQSYEKLT